jgi:hypothetical protein
MKFSFALTFFLSAFLVSIMPARPQVYAKPPAGFSEYMGWFPGDDVVFVSDKSKRYYYIEMGKTSRAVWGKDKVVDLDGGVVLTGGHTYCKTSDLDLLSRPSNRRLVAECTRKGWVER